MDELNEARVGVLPTIVEVATEVSMELEDDTLASASTINPFKPKSDFLIFFSLEHLL